MTRDVTAFVIAVPPVWSLPVLGAPLWEAAQRWRSCAALAADALMELSAATAERAGWQGGDADEYESRRARLVACATEAAELAGRAAAALESLAARADAVRRGLDESLARITAAVPCRGGPDRLLFAVRDAGQARRVHAATAEAADLRVDLDAAARAAEAELAVLARDWNRLAGALHPVAELPAPEPAEPVVVRGDGLTLVSTGPGDDEVHVTADPAGRTVVRVAGVTVAGLAEGRLVLRTGGGRDTVTVDPAVRAAVTVLSGAGDDRVTGGDVLHGAGGRDALHGRDGDDLLLGGDGRDYLDGGAGDDVADGGDGDDTAYGLAGRDMLRGGEGRDFLSGGRDADRLSGGAGDDILVGGAGGDVLHGGAGLDRAYADLAEPPADAELTQVAPPQAPGGAVQVAGTADFAARVESDLDLLRAVPPGRRLLADLDAKLAAGDGWLPGDGPDSLTIRELAPGTGNGYAGVDGDADRHVVDYDPGFDSLAGDAPPVVVLYHELAHAWDHLSGLAYPGTHPGDTMWDGAAWVPVPDRERVAVGLPVDDDGDPTTPDRLDPRHPYPLTENALRDELGILRRDTYGVPAAP